MSWTTPKTDWTGSDGVRDFDFNRIERNILELYNTESAKEALNIVVTTNGNDTTGNGTVSSPYRTIGKALSVLPKNLGDKAVTITVWDGTYNEDVVIAGFSGILTLNCSGIVRVNRLTVESSFVIHSGSQLNVVTTGGTAATVRNGGVLISTSTIYVSGSAIGIEVSYNGTLISTYTVTISNTTSTALDVYWGGRAYIVTLAGTGNGPTGMSASGGGIIQYGSTSLVATTRQTTNTGGRIYTGAQASVPNY